MQQLFPPAPGEPDLEALYAHPPGIRLNMITSLDGAATLAGSSRPLSGPADLRLLVTLRRQADVVLVGAGTARAERYGPINVPAEVREQRVARGQSPAPRVAVVTRGRGLDAASPLLRPGSGLLLLVPATAPPLPAHVDVAVVGTREVEPPRLAAALHERGLARVLCEGGPVLNAALLTAGLVDEICLTTSPLLVGGDGPRLAMGAAELRLPLELVSLLLADGMLFARWRVRRGADSAQVPQDCSSA